MSKRILILPALLLFSFPAWAQSLDKDSSFAVELDNITGMWMLECELEVDGIVAFEDHGVSASVQYRVAGTTAITIARSDFDIFGSERSKSESAAGLFAFEAKKMGDRLSVGIDLSWPSAGAQESFICVINISRITLPSTFLAGLQITQTLNAD
jgi:hypothetical protein